MPLAAPCAIGSTPCVAQSSALAVSACAIGEVPWNCDHSILYFLPRSGNSCGRRIIQYLDSSAGMVQPTRMVGMSCAIAGDVRRPAARPTALMKPFHQRSPVVEWKEATGPAATWSSWNDAGQKTASVHFDPRTGGIEQQTGAPPKPRIALPKPEAV